MVVHSEVRAVVELCPYVNEVLSLDRIFFYGNFIDVLERIAVFCRDNLWQKKFSIAFSPRWHNDTLLHIILAWMSGARERIGYGSYPFDSWQGAPPPQVAAQDNFFLTKKIVTPKSIVHDADKNFYLLKTAGFKVKKTHMELWYSAEDFQHAHELLEDVPPNCKKVMLGIGSREMNKKYPVEKYLVALRELAAKDLCFVIVGGRGELAEANFIEQNLPRGKVLNLVGKTTLREAEAVATQMDFYLGNDTGNLHMAAAAKVPVLGLCREAIDKDNILTGVLNGVQRFNPWQTKKVTLRPEHSLGDCATLPPCYGFCHHTEPHCITQITPQQIIDGFKKLEQL